MPNMWSTSSIKPQKGSPASVWIEVDPADGSTSGTAFTGPVIKDSSFDDNHAIDEQFDEGGNKFTTPGTVSRTLNLTFMQGDKATEEFAYDNDGKYFRIVKEKHVVPVNGNYQYKVYGICKIEKTSSKSAQGGEVPYTITVENNTSEIGVDLSEHANSIFQTTLTGTISIPASQGSIIAEIAE